MTDVSAEDVERFRVGEEVEEVELGKEEGEVDVEMVAAGNAASASSARSL